MIVVDANILALYTIEGERTSEANALRKMDPEWIIPSFWRIEFQSILWKYARFGGMPMEKALDLLDTAITLFSPNEVASAPDIVLREALNFKITVYDAQYIALARQFKVNCVTDDASLQKACPDVAISLLNFLKNPGGFFVRESKALYGTKKHKQKAG